MTGRGNNGKMRSQTIMVGTIRTHYIEAGEGEPLILLHSGEFGASSEMSWAYNIEQLARHYHVFAVDMIGYGHTAKLHDFEHMAQTRINHIRDFMQVLRLEEAHFIGNSMGGGLILNAASQEQPAWSIKSIITISGGGPLNPVTFDVLNNYDGTKEHMRRILDLLFWDERWKSEDIVEQRFRSAGIPGHWECLKASQLASPQAEPKKLHLPDYGRIKVPVMICAGEQDTIKLPDYAEKLKETIPHARVEKFNHCAHCAHIEHYEKFNELAVQFLKSSRQEEMR